LAKLLSPGVDFEPLDTESAWFQALTEVCARKSREVALAVRPTNGVHYYGRRGRDYEYQAEIPHHIELAGVLDKEIHRIAGDRRATLDREPLPLRAAEVPGGGKAPKNGLGVLKTTEEDLKDFTVAEGFEVNLFASTEEFPDMINPLQIAFDAKGRLWVATFSDYPVPVPGAIPNDKILILEDTDGDGAADKQTVFADGLLLPDGFEFLGDGVVVSVPTKLIHLRDTDGDDRADVEIELMRGFDDYDSHHGGFLSIAPNGLLTICEGVFHRAQIETPYGVLHAQDATMLEFNPRTMKLESHRQTASPNPWKISYTNWGEGYHFYGGGQNTDIDYYSVWTPSGNRLTYKDNMFKHGKGCTLAVVSSEHFPDEWQGNTVSGHLLGRNTVVYTPLGIEGGRYTQSGEPVVLMSSSNQTFRPVDMVFGLDGALYVSDFYYPIIGHAQHSVRDENRDYTHGRVWRVTNQAKPLVRAPKIDGASTEELFDLLAHPQARVRELVRNELSLHPAEEVMGLAEQVLKRESGETEASASLLAEMIWLFQRMGHEDMALVERLADSEFEKARVAAVRASRYWLRDKAEAALAFLGEALQDESDRVKIVALGAISYLTQYLSDIATLLDDVSAEKGSPVASALENAKRYADPPLQPVVPIFEVSEGAIVTQWTATSDGAAIWIRSKADKELTLRSKGNPFVNVDVNNLPVIRASGDTFTTEFQLPIHLKKGVNEIRYVLTMSGKKKFGAPDLYIMDREGGKPRGVQYPKNGEISQQWEAEYQKKYATVGENHIYLKAVPGKMVFNEPEITVPAGKSMKFIFENPDEIAHNFVLVAPGKGDVIGALADQLAASPEGIKREYVPDSTDVLFATPLLEGETTVELALTTPSEPGSYPFLCTFPGHWRIMRGVMIVE
ncbi:MAG: plastocyanin/azurin family copper-binding protein, partial [Verrucomicrobiota bacterium]